MISMHVLEDLVLHSWCVQGIAPEVEGGDEQEEGAVTVRLSPGIDS
jgi:hypothetical protein